MADIVKFVDSIASVPTIRLDINDGTTWKCTRFSAPPPRLRRAMSNNAMRDGVHVSSSLYDSRVLTLELAAITASEDTNATELQKLARELDRTDNYLMYQPGGATKPVFFRTFRSDMSQLEKLTGPVKPKAYAAPTIELLAEPFALGLRETLGPFTVNNDPAAGSNGLFFDVTGVIGDAAAPAVLVNTSRIAGFQHWAVRQHGTPTDMVWWTQAEAASGITLGTDTTNPGGGPDAAMSGTGTNNFVRTSFATNATLTVNRITWDLSVAAATAAQRKALRGRYRVVAVVRRSDAVSVMNAAVSVPGGTNTKVSLPLTTNRRLVDLGIAVIGTSGSQTGYAASDNSNDAASLIFHAERVSGAGTLDWDFLALIPADEASLLISTTGDSTSMDFVLDGVMQDAWAVLSGDSFAGTAVTSRLKTGDAGSYPALTPNQTNRLFFLEAAAGSLGAMTKGDASAIEVHYWPRYLHVRPSAT